MLDIPANEVAVLPGPSVSSQPGDDADAWILNFDDDADTEMADAQEDIGHMGTRQRSNSNASYNDDLMDYVMHGGRGDRKRNDEDDDND